MPPNKATKPMRSSGGGRKTELNLLPFSFCTWPAPKDLLYEHLEHFQCLVLYSTKAPFVVIPSFEITNKQIKAAGFFQYYIAIWHLKTDVEARIATIGYFTCYSLENQAVFHSTVTFFISIPLSVSR